MKISINSGFRRGGSLLQWDGEKFTAVKTAYECTYVGDDDSSFTTEVEDSFRGAVIRFWEASSHTYVNSAELIGFTEEELNAPSPIKGWVTYERGQVIKESILLRTFGDYITAIARNAVIMTTESVMATGKKHPSGNGLVLAELPYSWGCQAASHYVVINKGSVLLECDGCGEDAPEPVVTDTGWEFTSERQKREVENWVVEEFWYRAHILADSPEWKDLADFIRSAYGRGINPLPGLRKQHPGKWEFHKDGAPANGATVIFSETAGMPVNGCWAVSYIAAADVPRHELPVASTPPINSMAKVLEAVLV